MSFDLNCPVSCSIRSSDIATEQLRWPMQPGMPLRNEVPYGEAHLCKRSGASRNFTKAISLSWKITESLSEYPFDVRSGRLGQITCPGSDVFCPLLSLRIQNVLTIG